MIQDLVNFWSAILHLSAARQCVAQAVQNPATADPALKEKKVEIPQKQVVDKVVEAGLGGKETTVGGPQDPQQPTPKS